MKKDINWNIPFAVKLINFKSDGSDILGIEMSKEGLIYSKQDIVEYSKLIKEALVRTSEIDAENESLVRFYLNQFNLKIIEVKNQEELFDLFELNENNNNIITSLGGTGLLSAHVISCNINKIKNISDEKIIEINDDCIPKIHQEKLKIE
jgi:hypothetical protein